MLILTLSKLRKSPTRSNILVRAFQLCLLSVVAIQKQALGYFCRGLDYKFWHELDYVISSLGQFGNEMVLGTYPWI